jgi:hypothetical protein
MNVWYVYVFILCLGRGLATSWSLVQGVLRSVKWSWNWKSEARAQGGYRASEKMDEISFLYVSLDSSTVQLHENQRATMKGGFVWELQRRIPKVSYRALEARGKKICAWRLLLHKQNSNFI